MDRRQDHSAAVKRSPASPDRTAERPLRALGGLLVLQGLGLVGLGLFELRGALASGLGEVFSVETLLRGAPEALALVLFVPATFLMVLSGLLFLLGSRRVWTPAALSQTLALGGGLWLYAGPAPYYVYLLLAASVLCVLYLNSQSVRGLLHDAPPARDRSGGVV